MDISFSNVSTGFAIGFNNSTYGVIYKTSNQGLDWNIIDSLENTPIYGVRFYPGSGTGIIYGEILTGTKYRQFTSRTTNFGTTWTLQELPGISDFILIGEKMLSLYNEYLTGGNLSEAVIYHTTNGGSTFVTQHNGIIPDKFSLLQNFPNPFNPVTKINYSIPSNVKSQSRALGTNVKLIIYNTLGMEIATLVNEKQNAGAYSVDFNASNYSSGVYFYKLQTEGFVETKRMTLIR